MSTSRAAAAVLFIVAGVAFAAIALVRFGGPILMTLTVSWLWILWPIGFLALAAALVTFALTAVESVPARVAFVVAAVGLVWIAAARQAILPALTVGPTSISAIIALAGLLIGAVLVQRQRDLAIVARVALLLAAAAGGLWFSGMLGQSAFTVFGGLLATALILTFSAALVATGIQLRRSPVRV
jgi:hypothetical protein